MVLGPLLTQSGPFAMPQNAAETGSLELPFTAFRGHRDDCCLWHGIAAINEKDLAGNKVGRIGGEVGDSAGDILDLAKPANRI